MSEDYKFTGYGVISGGSSVKMFLGADQQFFMGGKNAMNIGTSNTFTAGLKADVMVGPAVNISLGPDWNKDAADAGKVTFGHMFAKYDFSTNKNFVFQIAHEGSSNYVTQSKFMCSDGFLAVGGFQKNGEFHYELYKKAITSLGRLAALTNFLMSAQQIAQTVESTNLKKGEELSGTRRQWAEVLPGVAAGFSAVLITRQAILAAIQREGNFKNILHPQSVLDLGKTNVFLGSLGDRLITTQQTGASLRLFEGTATLGVRQVNAWEDPYIEKFKDFKVAPTASLQIDESTIKSAATQMISIAVGEKQSSDTIKKTLVTGQKVVNDLRDEANKVAEQIYEEHMLMSNNEVAATAAKKLSLASFQPGIATAETALTSAKSHFANNPSLYLSAGGLSPVSLSTIDAEAPNINLISNNISLRTKATTVPLPPFSELSMSDAGGVTIIHSTGSEISISNTGDIKLSLLNPTTSVNITKEGITVEAFKNSIEVSSFGIFVNLAGSKKLKFTLQGSDLGAFKVFG